MNDSLNLSPKQYNFCLAYMETGNATLAYRRAYNAQNMKSATVNRKAKELLDNGKIAASLVTLRMPMREKMAITVESLTWKLNQACERAFQKDQLGVVVAAVIAIAKLHGLLKQKLEIQPRNIEDLSAEELKQLLITAISDLAKENPGFLEEIFESAGINQRSEAKRGY